jgi:hypothetical protein
MDVALQMQSAEAGKVVESPFSLTGIGFLPYAAQNVLRQ